MDQEQLTLLAERLQTIGVRRREFLKVAGALAGAAVVQSALGPLAPVQAQPMLPPGTRLAKEQVFRWATRQ